MGLELKVQQAFAQGGILSGSVAQFASREGQTEMAIAVAHAIDSPEALVVQASTGVGKTFSYLVPALLSGERVLLSTATKALQDQLFARDIPHLVKALAVSIRTALLKGRSSYVCLHRVALAESEARLSGHETMRTLRKIQVWAQLTRAGDLAELHDLDERSPLIPLVTSTRENCLGAQCPQFRLCHVNLARREALTADVVVINHHLFFADLAVRESGIAELLPSVRIAIFDEAHQLNEIGVQLMGKNLTTGQLIDFCRDLLSAGLQMAQGLVDWQAIVGYCERVSRELKLCVNGNYSATKLRWIEQTPEGVDAARWSAALNAVVLSLLRACEALDTVSEIAPDFVRLHERAAALGDRAKEFLATRPPGCVRWLEIGSQLRLVESPLDIADVVQKRLFDVPGNDSKSWIFTSATLGNDENLSWFTQPCGLSKARILRVGSPFDYARQAALYIPQNFPKPSDTSHPLRVAESAASWCRQLKGRTMVLTTTLRALRVIGDALHVIFESVGDVEVLVQGSMPKNILIERFRRGATADQRGCVLVACASFWEGIDVPGEALQLVIIDKLPFPPPNDPMAEARSRALEAEGRNAFNDYFLPEAAVALQQGAGRLIRRETDQGVLVICDTRLSVMGYGKRLLKALPPMERLASEGALNDRLSQLTKICTMGYQMP